MAIKLVVQLNLCFEENWKLIVIGLSEQQSFDVDPTTIQQINFHGNLDRVGNTTIFFIIKEVKETIMDFLKETTKVLQKCFRNLFRY